MKSPVILLIEDEILILMDIESALIEEGFEVLTASNGSDAIKALEAYPGRIHGVVTDIRLGNGPSGWDIGRHVRQATPAMPIVYMSGDSAHDWEAQGVPNSIMIPKPFVHSQLLTALANLMNNSDQIEAP